MGSTKEPSGNSAVRREEGGVGSTTEPSGNSAVRREKEGGAPGNPVQIM